TSIGYALFDFIEEFWIILADIVIELWLALGEVILWELVHEMLDGVECTASFTACLPKRPEPGDIDMCMTCRAYINIQWRTGLRNALGKERMCSGNTGIKLIIEWLACLQPLESFVERVEQLATNGIMFV